MPLLYQGGSKQEKKAYDMKAGRGRYLLPVGLHHRQAQWSGPAHWLVGLGHSTGAQGQPLHDVLGAVKHLV